MKKGPIGALVAVISLFAAAPAMAADCPNQAPSRTPFADWGDGGSYFLAPGGDFEAGNGWTLAGGASLAAGESPAAEGSSLVLPPGASATSPPICVGDDYKHGRMFGAATDDAKKDRAKVMVEVLGAADEQVDSFKVDGDWDATHRFQLDPSDFLLDPDTGTGSIQLQFTGTGPATAVIDDAYIDPKARG